MQPANNAITVLSILDLAILILIPLLDKRLYRNYFKKPEVMLFFVNTGYKSRFHRFVYSRFGTLLILVIYGHPVFN